MRKKRGKKFRPRKFDAIVLYPNGNTLTNKDLKKEVRNSMVRKRRPLFRSDI